MKKYARIYPALLWVALTFWTCQAFAQAERQRDSLLNLYRQSAEDTAGVWALMETGKLFFDSEPDSALQYLDRALSLAESIGFDRGIARCRINKGYVLYDKGEFEKVLDLCSSAIPICERLRLGKELVSIYNMMGNVWNTKGNHWLAIDYYEQALEAMKTAVVPPHFPIVVRNNITILYIDLKLYRKVLEYSYQMLREAEAIGAEASVGVSFEHLANAYKGLRQRDSALHYFERAVDMARRLDYKVLLCSSLGNTAELLLQKGEVEEALARYREAVDIAQKVDDPYQLMINLHGLSLLFFDQKDVPRAREYALRALERAMEMSLNDYTYSIYLTLSDIALAEGNWEQYAQYRDEFHTLRDSLNNQSLVHAIQELETKYETENKERQIEQLQQIKAIDELKIQQKNGLIGGLGGLAGLLVLTGALGYRNLRNRRRIAEQEVLIQDQIIREMQREKQLSTLDAMLQGQEEERGRLARDLHDGLGGMLSGIQQTLFQMKGNQILPETAATGLNQVIAHLDASISELRHIARNMMPEALVRFGLKDALQDYCDYLQETADLTILFQPYGMEERLSQQTEVVMFRIVQELLNNVIKHAGATQAIVQLLRHQNKLHLTVEDNGKGMDLAAVEKAPGVGWVNIRSRVGYLNGALDLHSLPGKGTSVSIECFLENNSINP